MCICVQVTINSLIHLVDRIQLHSHDHMHQLLYQYILKLLSNILFDLILRFITTISLLPSPSLQSVFLSVYLSFKMFGQLSSVSLHEDFLVCMTPKSTNIYNMHSLYTTVMKGNSNLVCNTISLSTANRFLLKWITVALQVIKQYSSI